MARHVLLFCLSVVFVGAWSKTVYNNRPIIGILAQATDGSRSTHGDTFIPANYVKYLEQAGARVVPIRVKEKADYYVKLLSKINGVLFPGGSVGIVSSYYAQAARIIYQYAIKANDAGDHFPLWGTCQGFQLLTNLTAHADLLQETDCSNISLPLNLVPGYKTSRMMGRLSQNILRILSTENVTPNFHTYGLLLDTFKKTKSLNSFYRLLSTNKGGNGKVFVSTIEGNKYPFYGTQWHPEKINFDWNPQHDIDHGSNGVLVSHYFSSFFISEARRSQHKFASPMDAAGEVIQNAFFNYQDDGTFEQIYYFNFTKAYN